VRRAKNLRWRDVAIRKITRPLAPTNEQFLAQSQSGSSASWTLARLISSPSENSRRSANVQAEAGPVGVVKIRPKLKAWDEIVAAEGDL
jgi:hypothetical protein